jgi:hypothetical protein
MRCQRELAIAAHRVGNNLTIAQARNVSREIFSKFGSYFKPIYNLVLYQQGDLGGNASMVMYLNQFHIAILSTHY